MTATQTAPPAPAAPRFDGAGDVVGGDHLPDLYKPAREASRLPGLPAVGPETVNAYREHGYLAVDGVFDPTQVADAIAAIDDLVAGRNAAFNGVIFEAAARDGLDRTDAAARLDFVRKLMHFVAYDDRLNRLAHDPRLLATVRTLLGDREPRLFQDMALLKPPKIGREKPWHQDHAYFDFDLSERVVGVWVALDPASVENGCMQVLHGGHKHGPILHWKIRDWQICDREMLGKSSVACPLDPGGALFFDSLLPHGTPTNHSPLRRRALQFHYCAADAVNVPTERRLAVFGADGKNVTC